MEAIDFYKKIITIFHKHRVEYLLVGGYAVSIHGYVRASLDLDIWVNNTKEAFTSLFDAFREFGYQEDDCTTAINELSKGKNIELFDNDNNKIDIIQLYSTQLTFEVAFKRKKIVDFFDTQLFVIGMDDLIDTKIRSGRPKDLDDARQLKLLQKSDR